MTIYWVKTDSTDALDALAAVEQALAQGDTGTPPATKQITTDDPDRYLTENIALAHATWPVDPHEIVNSNRLLLAHAINLFQRLVKKLTWWYALPQWQQVSQFHGAAVRVIDVLVERQRLLSIRLNALESTHLPMHVYALEQQIQALRSEQRELRRRVAELEQQLAASRKQQ